MVADGEVTFTCSPILKSPFTRLSRPHLRSRASSLLLHGIPPAERGAGLRIVDVAIAPFTTGVTANEPVEQRLDGGEPGRQRDGEHQAAIDASIEVSGQLLADLGGELVLEGADRLDREDLDRQVATTPAHAEVAGVVGQLYLVTRRHP